MALVSKEVTVVISVLLLGFCTFSEARLDSAQERGPILFPRNKGDEEDGGNASNVITIPKSNRVGATPYEKFKRKYTNVGDTAEVKDRIFKAHNLHMPRDTKVRHSSALQYKEFLAKKNYAFSYKVVDSATGDDFSHSQVRTAKTTNGEYRVRLPDGRIQIVKYTADKNGYKADVRYEEDSRTVPEEPVGHPNSIPAANQLQLLSSNSFRNQVYYQDIDRPDIRSRSSTGHPTVSPSLQTQAFHTAEVQGLQAYGRRHNEQVPHPVDVEIYTTNARDYSMGFFPISSTTPSLLHKEFESYQHAAITPNIITNAESGIVVPVTNPNHKDNTLHSIQFVATPTPTPTPTTFVVVDHYGQVVDTYHLIAPPTATATAVVA
nr:unnamed protein product [Callosobruchus chinensis]